VDGSSSNRHDNGEKQSIRSSLEAIGFLASATKKEWNEIMQNVLLLIEIVYPSLV
jgi:hypothetical protein